MFELARADIYEAVLGIMLVKLVTLVVSEAPAVVPM
jgi:hypothetical protein